MNNPFVKFYKNSSKLPLSLAGTALGTATMGNAWGLFNNPIGFAFDGSFVKYITITISLLLIIIMLIRYIIHPVDLINDFKSPVSSNFIPTIFMALFVISGFFGAVNCNWIQIVIWLVCVILHLIYIVSFLIYHLVRFKFNNYMASWFIPPIGIVVACVMSNNLGSFLGGDFAAVINLISKSCWYIGIAFYVIMLPPMMYKYLFTNHLKEKKLQTFGVMAAPPNLLLAGYLTTFSNQDINNHKYFFVYILCALAILFTLIVYLSLFKVSREKFSPLLGCYTFPLAIGMISMIKMSEFLFTSLGADNIYVISFKIWALIETIIGTIVIVLFNFAIFTYSYVVLFVGESQKNKTNKFIKYIMNY